MKVIYLDDAIINVDSIVTVKAYTSPIFEDITITTTNGDKFYLHMNIGGINYRNAAEQFILDIEHLIMDATAGDKILDLSREVIGNKLKRLEAEDLIYRIEPVMDYPTTD